MKTITIPELGAEVSRLGMGSMIFSPERKELTFELLDAFIAAGGNLIDTAEVYGGGQSERAIGLWLRERGARDQVAILSKGCIPAEKITPEGIREAISGSLERLQIDTIDLWMLHRDDPNKPVGLLIDALNAEVERGRIRAFGCSNWFAARIEEANAYARKHGLMGMAASSPHLSLATAKEPYWPGCVAATPEERAWYEAHQFPLVAWSSQARGFFSGRYRPDDPSDPDMVRVFYSDENFEKLRRAEMLGKRLGVDAIQIALAYVLHQPFPTVALIGPANLGELESCLQAERLTLPPEVIAWLELRNDKALDDLLPA